MDQELFSGELQPDEASLSPFLKEDLELLRGYVGHGFEILKWDDDRIAVPITVEVALPSRGNIDDIDIRAEEQVLIIFHRTKYPDTSPLVYSDRKDFPKDKLSHLYISKSGKPVRFCLLRGNYDEWFANKRITDLVILAREWLEDAASGDLVEDGDQFDPVRLDGYRGSIIYSYQNLFDTVRNRVTLEGFPNFALVLFEEKEPYKAGESVPSFQMKRVLSKDTIKPILEALGKADKDIQANRLMFGAIIWSTEDYCSKDFFTSLPNDLDELKAFAEKVGVDISTLLKAIPIFRLSEMREFPVVVAVNRPKPLIGYNGNIEFFNYYLTINNDDIQSGHITRNVPVAFQKHAQPLSLNKAKEIAGYQENLAGVFFGCGAVGSKVVMHLVRQGITDLALFDKDKVEPHNMVRYGLTAESIGVNKAVALKGATESIYEQAEFTLIGSPNEGRVFFEYKERDKLLEHYSWLFDFTASMSFQNYFIKQPLLTTSKVAKGMLTDNGSLGILLFEGQYRNPRIDDLQVFLQSLYGEKEYISSWLQREFERSKADSVLVNVGVGCNSETTILSDDTISLHGAAFSRVIKSKVQEDESENGTIFLSMLGNDNVSISTDLLKVEPFSVLDNCNGTGWQVRLKAGLSDVLTREMDRAYPDETGGVLIGVANSKTKCIHVTDVILAPPDSEANEVCFIRGIDGLKEQVDEHKTSSGQTFGYIGEWHSHPRGPNGWSCKDKETMVKFKQDYQDEQVSIPVFILIVTPDNLLPYVI